MSVGERSEGTSSPCCQSPTSPGKSWGSDWASRGLRYLDLALGGAVLLFRNLYLRLSDAHLLGDLLGLAEGCVRRALGGLSGFSRGFGLTATGPDRHRREASQRQRADGRQFVSTQISDGQDEKHSHDETPDTDENDKTGALAEGFPHSPTMGMFAVIARGEVPAIIFSVVFLLIVIAVVVLDNGPPATRPRSRSTRAKSASRPRTQ